MLDLGTLTMSVEVDSGNATQQLQELVEEVKKNDSAMNESSEATSGFIAKLQEIGGQAGSIAATAIAGIVLAVKNLTPVLLEAGEAVFNFVADIAESGDEIDKQSQKLGMTAQEYQTLAFAAEHCGFSVGVANAAMRNLNDTEFAGDFNGAIAYLQSIEDGSERAAEATRILGERQAQEMTVLWNSTTSMEEYAASLQGLGAMSDEMVADSAAFEDSLTDLKYAFNGVKNVIGSALMPVVTRIMGYIISVMPIVSRIIKGLMNVLSPLIAAVESWFLAIGNLFTGLSDSVQSGTGIISVAVSAITAIISTIVNVIAEVVGFVADIINGDFSDAFDRLYNIVYEVVNLVVNLFLGLVDSLLKSVLSLGTKLKTAASNAFGAMKDAITSKINEIKSWVATKMNEIRDTVAGLKDKLFSVGKDIFDGLLQGFMAKWEAIVSWVTEKANWIANTLGSAKAKLNVDGHHRVGLSEVPYDGYIAELHKGEMVLTAAEANHYSKHRFQNGDASTNTYLTVNNYSPKALDEAESARQFRRAQRELALGF